MVDLVEVFRWEVVRLVRSRWWCGWWGEVRGDKVLAWRWGRVRVTFWLVLEGDELYVNAFSGDLTGHSGLELLGEEKLTNESFCHLTLSEPDCFDVLVGFVRGGGCF